MKKQYVLTVFYDGLCKVCSAEISYYQKQVGSQNINFVDIFSNEFDAKKENLDPAKIHKHLHARKQDGSIVVGVNVFIEIWSHLENFKSLSRIAKNNFVKSILKVGYKVFADIRPYLPRRKKEDCSDSPYCETNITQKN